MDALFSPLFESNIWREPLGRSIFCTESDDRAMRNLFSSGELGGYWPADPAYAYEDSAGTTLASVGGVVGLRLNAIAGYPNAVQATTANKPYLRKTPVSNKLWLDSNTTDGTLTATFSGSLGSACTVATVGAEGVTIAENQTVSTTYNLTPPYGYNGDVLIINRALTAAEKALVTRVMTRNVPVLGSELITNGSFQPVNDGGIGHDNGNGTVDGWTVQDSYLSVINEKLTIRSATSSAYSAGYVTLSGINGQLLVSAKMERIINSYPYLFLVLNSDSPYNQYGNIIINSATINIKQAVLVPASINVRIAFYATYSDAVDQTVTVADFSVKAIL